MSTLLPRPALGTALDPVRGAERERIIAALESCAWNQSRAAEALGMSRRTFVARLDAYGIPRPQKS